MMTYRGVCMHCLDVYDAADAERAIRQIDLHERYACPFTTADPVEALLRAYRRRDLHARYPDLTPPVPFRNDSGLDPYASPRAAIMPITIHLQRPNGTWKAVTGWQTRVGRLSWEEGSAGGPTDKPKKVDKSAGAKWMCSRCPSYHEPGSKCPPLGVWLGDWTKQGRPAAVATDGPR